MQKQLRITPGEIEQAYIQTGFGTISEMYLKGHRACPIVALAVAAGQELYVPTIIEWADKKYGYAYRRAFCAAFDGRTPQCLIDGSREGINDGLEARKAILGG